MMSPFAVDKFEHDPQSHTYYLPESVVRVLEQPKPVIICGSRGSGKTTLLQSLDSIERLQNRSLRQQLQDNPFRGQFIGVYAKLPLHPCRLLGQLHAKGTPLEGLVFGVYLDLVAIELLAAAVSHLVGDGVLRDIAGDGERLAVMKFVDYWKPLLEWGNVAILRCQTLLDMSAAIEKVRKKLEWCAQQRMAIEVLISQIQVPDFGEFGRTSSDVLADFCNKSSLFIDDCEVEARQNWHFKVCFDEAEVLSPQQQLVVNTLIRLAQVPLFHVVSYVSRPVDLTNTYKPQLTLQKADFNLLMLDKNDQDANEFRLFAEGVASVRVQNALRDPSARFECKRSLGSLSLNGLIHSKVNSSEKTAVVNELRELADSYIRNWEIDETENLETVPRYIEGFLANRRCLLPTELDSKRSKRRIESTEFRKKNVVGFLAICRLLGLRSIPFASAEMLLGVSDGCIRDFLSQLNIVFGHAYSNQGDDELREFLKKSVPWQLQEQALRHASEKKRDSVPGAGVLYPIHVGRLVKGLAEITAIVQGSTDKPGDQDFSESGIFKLLGGSDDQRCKARALIRDAAEAGFLRIRQDGDQPEPLNGFRVHCSLAPAFGFSYRGAYYDVALKISDFHRILDCPNDVALRELAKELTNRELQAEDRQRRLFPLDDFEGVAE